MKRLEVRWSPSTADPILVGTLAEASRRVYFEYSPDFLARRVELSPLTLRARPGLIEHIDVAFGPLPGVFDDSLPDGWGLLLMDRHFRREGVDPRALSPLDRLAYIGGRAMGALSYHPPIDEREASPTALDLKALGEHAREVFEGHIIDVLPQLERAGGSPGGARPKVIVGLKGDQVVSGDGELPAGFEPWIVKFTTKQDGPDASRVEQAYMELARHAGIDVPSTRAITVGRGRTFFAIRRFDRVLSAAGLIRVHMHTLANLLHANFRVPSLDYVDLLKVTATITRNQQDVLRAFRVMVFNVVMHNRDDHGKNFSFLMDATGEWSLAPAYDLTYSIGPGGEHSTAINGEVKSPTRDHLLAVAAKAGITPAEAAAALDAVNDAASCWRLVASSHGVSKGRISKISKAIRRQ